MEKSSQKTESYDAFSTGTIHSLQYLMEPRVQCHKPLIWREGRVRLPVAGRIIRFSAIKGVVLVLAPLWAKRKGKSQV